MNALSAKTEDVYGLDIFGLHAGNSNVLKTRLTSWIRYGNPINLATIQNGTSNQMVFFNLIYYFFKSVKNSMKILKQF